MSDRKTVCWVTPAHLAHNPRLLKEAETLSAAGCRVRVIWTQCVAWAVELDRRVAAGHPDWSFEPVSWVGRNFSEKFLKAKTFLRQKAGQALCAAGLPGESMALSRLYASMLAKAVSGPADLFIGHNLAALPVVAAASSRTSKPFAFDLEDAHSIVTGVTDQLGRRIASLERRYLALAASLTASSPGIADHYQKNYGIRRPEVVLNVFGFREPKKSGVHDRKDPGKISMHWFSQTVGLDRGLQDAVAAHDRIGAGQLELHVRGDASESVRRELLKSVRDDRVRAEIFFHEQTDPDELFERVSEHDVGLALEPGISENNRIAISNKLFLSLAAGLAIASSGTPGHRFVTDQAPGIGFSYPPGDVAALAAGLKRWIEDRDQLDRSKRAAIEASRTRFNWEIESRKFLGSVRACRGFSGI